MKYLELASSNDKKVLFIGTKRQAATLIAQEAKRSNSYYVNHRWLGGMLTNWTTMKERIEKLKDLEKQEAEGTFELLTKKEAALRRKEVTKLRKHLDGIKTMSKLPDVAIIIDQKREMTAIAECRKLGIPIISILDTNCDPDLIDIPIPGNDDAVRSIKLIINLLTDSIIKGQIKS
jgi:small subunit ribosomal protein S2